MTMSRALVFMAEGFEEIEAITTIDVLRRGGVEVVTASISESLEVKGAHGIVVKADNLASVAAMERYDAVILPGGGLGTENLGASELVIETLRRQKNYGGFICAICAAPTVLVKANILEEGQHITCYPTCVMELDRPAAEAPVFEDRSVITARGPGSSLLFGLVILKALEGNETAKKTARAMVTDIL